MFLSVWLRQFRLLFVKNLLLLWRSKLWAVGELVLPILFSLGMFILMILMNKYLGDIRIPVMAFKPIAISGSAADFQHGDDVNMTSYLNESECKWKIAYHVVGNDTLITKVLDRFGPMFIGKPFNSTEEMTNFLLDTKPTMSGKPGGGCHVFTDERNASVLGGIVIDTTNPEHLQYNIFAGFNKQDGQPLDDDWADPYAPAVTTPLAKMEFYTDSHWNLWLLSLQYAIDDEYAKTKMAGSMPAVNLTPLPQPAFHAKIASMFLLALPIVWAIGAFLPVVHSAREVAHERHHVKSFLSVMGLSTAMFYCSHIFFNFLKCFIVFMVMLIPMMFLVSNVNLGLLFLGVVLYGLGAVLFGVLIATVFKSPNTVLKVTLLAWIASVGVSTYGDYDTLKFWKCFFCCLNINTAFRIFLFGIVSYMNRSKNLGFSNLFEDEGFSAGWSLLLLVGDVIWMTSFIFIIDFVVEHTSDINIKATVCWMFKKMFRRKGASESIQYAMLEDCNETDAGLEGTAKDIELSGLVKIYAGTNDRAVDGLDLTAYRGQVTVLLGHNGAGKSTTFSMICGLTRPSEGKISICGDDMGKATRRDDVGLCPQHNALFPKLTVDEHLWLIHGLKGAKNDWKDEAMQLKIELDLCDKKDTFSMNLSGGMKRKLCVCMALIGDSKVVLLDEPTAGMDPGARRDVEKVLEKIKGERTVLLTTHYMDEAELLGDRVAIMAKGRVVCSGSPQYLKNKFASGYQLTIVLAEGRDVIKDTPPLMKLANQKVPGAELGSVHGKQIQMTLPKEQQASFSALFADLENGRDSLGVDSFGLSLCTLEQVFLRVGELTEPSENKEQKAKDALLLNQELIDSQNEQRHRGPMLWLNQLAAILLKRIFYVLRNWQHLLTQIGVPILLLGFTSLMLWNPDHWGADIKSRELTAATFGPARIVMHNENISDKIEMEYHRLAVEQWTEKRIISTKNNLNITINEVDKFIPAPSMGITRKQSRYELLFNTRAIHSAPTTINLFSNARLAGSARITPTLSVYPVIEDEVKEISRRSNMYTNYLMATVLVIAFSMVTSSFVVFLVEERMCKFAHQQSLSGISPFIFWFGSLLFDSFFYFSVVGIFSAYFMIFGWFEGQMTYMLLLWLFYFWASVPFIYSLSFVFSTASKANVVLIIVQVLACITALIVTKILKMKPLTAVFGRTLEAVLFFLLPSFGLARGCLILNEISMDGLYDAHTMDFDHLGMPLLCMFVYGTVATVIFLLFQFKKVRFAVGKLFGPKYRPPNEPAPPQMSISTVSGELSPLLRFDDDSDVIREKQDTMTSSEGDMPLRVEGLVKQFKQHLAVNQLTFCVHPKECFGLLGINGAGKTTTFDILTGQTFATNGRALIGGIDVSKQLEIGYCPQFDALLPDLSGRQSLKILARMYGFRNPSAKADLVLRAVGMKDHGHNLSRNYSGGQRRKLSTGLALLAPTKIVILDEPTAGIDPIARRAIWSVMSCVRDHSSSSLVLTSHSMDECEALCSRVAVLKAGRMVAIGTSQHLKSKFGNSYSLLMVAPSSEARSSLMEEVSKEFPDSVLKTSPDSKALTLKWQLVKTRSDLWSVVFSRCQELSVRTNCVDFCLAQSSLEEAFLHISQDSIHAPPPPPIGQMDPVYQGQQPFPAGTTYSVPPLQQ